MLVCPTATPIRYARRVERTTALANFGSATSTSLMSRGRSITTDFPMPSCTKRELESEPMTCRPPAPGAPTAPGSAARAGAAAMHAASAAAVKPPAVSFQRAFIPSPLLNSLRRGHGRNAEAHRVNSGALARCAIIVVRKRRFACIRKAAQRQRHRAELARECELLRLARREFERRGPADHDLLPVLLAERLVDREHANVGHDGFRRMRVPAAGLVGIALAPRQDDVDMVVRQDEAAGPGLG